MKKLITALFATALFLGCTRDNNEYRDICLRIVNNTDYTLSFSNIDCDGPNNGYGDYTFYPEKSFSIEPQGEYRQQIDNEWAYEGHIIAPYSMDLECNGKTIHFEKEDKSIYENPCNGDKWHSQSATRREPAMYIFLITNTHIEKWFGKQ